MNRKQMSIPQEVADLISAQMIDEMMNYTLYREFSLLCYRSGLLKLYNYYQKRAKEELEHHQWCFDYLVESGCEFKYENIPANNLSDLEVSDTFELTVEREIATTQKINAIYKLAVESNDNFTRKWLDSKLIPEQLEEENVSRFVRDLSEQDTDWLTKEDSILNAYDNRILK